VEGNDAHVLNLIGREKEMDSSRGSRKSSSKNNTPLWRERRRAGGLKAKSKKKGLAD
jgi:hypothetical protein